jgi:hypothetical protein
MPDHQMPPGSHGSPDPELAALLPAITGPAGQFRHREHVNLAFLAVQRYGMPEAIGKICTWIRHMAAYERRARQADRGPGPGAVWLVSGRTAGR